MIDPAKTCRAQAHQGDIPGRPVIFTRVNRSSMRTTTNKRRGTRCSLRRFRIDFLPTGGRQPSSREEGYAFADGDLARELQRLGRGKAPFCAYVQFSLSRRLEIVALASNEEIVAAAKRARRSYEDAEWEAAAPNPSTSTISACPMAKTRKAVIDTAMR